jgi:DeoR family transcriptional regulator, ulaG and ulaABCDEF operon transcriptional repressor
MLEAERHRLIVRLVQERSIVGVPDLVEMLGASEATVRRDINAMAEQGLLRRIRGGAESLVPRYEAHRAGMPSRSSQGTGVAQKRAIARAAVQLVQDGESIIINGGTTTFAMVEFMAERSLDVLTNSIPIVAALQTTRNRVLIPAGTVYPEQNIVLSPYESDGIEHFWGQKLFTGCYGLNRFGMMETDPVIVRAHEKLLKRSDELIVLADSRKLRQRSPLIVARLDCICTLITDDGATEEELGVFRAAGVKVITVVVSAEQLAQPSSAGAR